MSMLAVSTGSITVDLQDVPNVPIRFAARTLTRRESSSEQADPTNQTHGDNSAVAWSWKIFLENPSNPAALLFLPMTKVTPDL